MTTSNDLYKLLKERHARDIFIGECKTHSGMIKRDVVIMDAWTMNRSWTHFETIGYEIKVSRQDFIRDNKWERYLPYCHKFFFVVPNDKIVQKNELPAEVGLIVATVAGNRLLMKKKSARREIELPNDFLLYLIKCRAKITGTEWKPENTIEYWREWMQGKADSKQFGYCLRGKIAEEFRKRVTEAEEASQTAVGKLAQAEALVKRIENVIGRKLRDGERNEWASNELSRQIKRTQALIDPDFERAVNYASERLKELEAMIEKIKKEPE